MNKVLFIGLLTIFFNICAYSQVYRSPAKDVVVLKNSTNEVVDSSYAHFYMGEYDKFALELRLSGGVSCKAYASNDESLSNTDETDWINFNTVLFGADSIYNVSVMKYSASEFSPMRILLKFRNTDNTNSNKVILSRYK
jgi:hypothetical protein